MLIMHLSTTPLVGAPGSICRALNMHEGVEARWAVLDATVGSYDKMVFDLDLQWKNDRQQIIDLVQRCDVLHLHNFIGLDSKIFSPIDFRVMWNQRRTIVRHFHSTPMWVAKNMGVSEETILNCPIPKLVIAQHQERFIGNARMVPNIVFPNSKICRLRSNDAPLRIGYAPSRFLSARAARWDTKGYPETVKMLQRLVRTARKQGLGIEIDLIELVSHSECLRRKSDCDIFIDELVTGSYHLNTLEALCTGIACLTFLDRRTQQAISALTGRTDFPAISVGLEHAHDVLLELCKDRESIRQIGMHSKEWMALHWEPFCLARLFLDAYTHVSSDPHKSFPRRFGDDLASQFSIVKIHDQLWLSRAKQWPRLPHPWFISAKSAAGRMARKIGFIN